MSFRKDFPKLYNFIFEIEKELENGFNILGEAYTAILSIHARLDALNARQQDFDVAFAAASDLVLQNPQDYVNNFRAIDLAKLKYEDFCRHYKAERKAKLFDKPNLPGFLKVMDKINPSIDSKISKYKPSKKITAETHEYVCGVIRVLVHEMNGLHQASCTMINLSEQLMRLIERSDASVKAVMKQLVAYQKRNKKHFKKLNGAALPPCVNNFILPAQAPELVVAPPVADSADKAGTLRQVIYDYVLEHPAPVPAAKLSFFARCKEKAEERRDNKYLFKY